MTSGIVSRAGITDAAKLLGLAGKPVCIHASLRSFQKLESGAETLIEGLRDTGATVIVATIANQAFSIPPPPGDRPARNGADYAYWDRLAAEQPWPGQSDVYDHTRTEVDTWLGATSASLAARPDRPLPPPGGQLLRDRAARRRDDRRGD